MKAIKSISANTFSIFTCFIFWLVTCPVLLGQAGQKRMLTSADYKQWSTLYPDKISNNGNWASYRLNYKYTDSDTLVLQKIAGGQQHKFANCRTGKFNAELQFGCISRDTLYLRNLNTAATNKIANAVSFDFSENNRYIAVFTKSDNKKHFLEIRTLAGNVIYQRTGITNYYFDPDQNGVVFNVSDNNRYSTELILFKDRIDIKILAANQSTPLKKLYWNAGAISFMDSAGQGAKFYYYSIGKDKLSILDSKRNGFPKGMQITDSPLGSAAHAEIGEKVLVRLKFSNDSLKSIDPKAVEIWNTKDKLLFEYRKYFGNPKLSDKMAVWNIQNNKVQLITDSTFSAGFISSDYNFAFIYDPIAYEPQSRQFCPYDLYILDLNSGTRKPVVMNYTADAKPVGSPDGAYLCYAKNGHWWIYSIKNDSHICITLDLPNSFFAEDNNSPSENKPYGIGGWTSDSEIILNDRYDLWKISLDGKTKKRLTNGRDIQKTFRINSFTPNLLFDKTVSSTYALDLKKGFLLETFNKETGDTGLSWWKINSGVKEMVWGNNKISLVKKAQDKNIYMYVSERFESSPKLMLYKGTATEIMQSNPHQKHFYWSRNEKIDYISDGIKTKGILFYPADFKADKKYPMVVHIYERQFSYLNDYINPSMISDDGFNVNNYTANGYFVLFPDINYEFANLKKSVTNSVLAAVDAAVAKGNINPSKVGLIGHSFGGYETDLIITQTDRFAAAVSGAAWTDLVSSYLYVGPLFRRPDFFRGEDHQIRIGKSLFEDMKSYLNNSPILLASSVSIPLLSWAGAEDRHVNTQNSMEFYLALRRLNKEHILLVYPEEEHTLQQKKNAQDLNIRIMEWFNYYLKDENKKEWFSTHYN
ncbi:prolyl oligopeptidase family serine peptidase [Flavobacterium plurextorum]|uniref:S9 family peptidase n=1 Tax=Flavobacterium TaxID=237 RepID=UPI00214DAD00|nr:MULTISPECIES: prolyl oligopeptidase family serine peptidase [Flavobacterium]UUW08647.1 prolyl oligopeptidase family serine peptidase [Flavobacterium plurextorum]